MGLDAGDIILVGDDVIDRGIWNRFYGSPRVKNRGIALEGTACTAYRLPELMQSKPSKVFLCTGLYDLKQQKPAQEVADALLEMATQAKKISPKSEIYVLGITPDPKLHALGAEWVMYEVIREKMTQMDTLKMITLVPFTDLLVLIAVIFGGAGLFVGIVGGWTSIRKFLKV